MVFRIRALEAAILELRQMFVDMAKLTMAQGKLMDSIEDHVAHITEFVQKGNLDLEHAIRSQSTLRRSKRQ